MDVMASIRGLITILSSLGYDLNFQTLAEQMTERGWLCQEKPQHLLANIDNQYVIVTHDNGPFEAIIVSAADARVRAWISGDPELENTEPDRGAFAPGGQAEDRDGETHPECISVMSARHADAEYQQLGDSSIERGADFEGGYPRGNRSIANQPDTTHQNAPEPDDLSTIDDSVPERNLSGVHVENDTPHTTTTDSPHSSEGRAPEERESSTGHNGTGRAAPATRREDQEPAGDFDLDCVVYSRPVSDPPAMPRRDGEPSKAQPTISISAPPDGGAFSGLSGSNRSAQNVPADRSRGEEVCDCEHLTTPDGCPNSRATNDALAKIDETIVLAAVHLHRFIKESREDAAAIERNIKSLRQEEQALELRIIKQKALIELYKEILSSAVQGLA